MVRKGSPVRVRQRLFREGPAARRFPPQLLGSAWEPALLGDRDAVAQVTELRGAPTMATPDLRRGRLAVLSRGAGGEEVDEEPVDALGRVVVDPVRGVGQALDAFEVGHVVVVGGGEGRAEV